MSLARLICVLGCILLCACEQPQKRPGPFAFTFLTEADPGVVLAGIEVLMDGQPVGISNAHGIVQASVRGVPGTSVNVSARCPEGHDPSDKLAIKLLRTQGASQDVRKTLRCTPTERTAAFVVRAKNGPGLPVHVNGKPAATTNADGVAQIAFQASPGTEYTVQLMTGDKPLRPKNPIQHFALKDRDDVFVMAQVFEVIEPRRVRRKARSRIVKIR